MIAFGDIIKLDGQEYVYLAFTGEVLYLAWIPNKDISQNFIKRREKAFTTD